MISAKRKLQLCSAQKTMRKTHPEYFKQWRKAHPKKRNANRKSNYHKNRPKIEKAKRRPTGIKHRPWTIHELRVLLVPDGYNDRDLARGFGRSVQAIQQMRYKIKSGL